MAVDLVTEPGVFSRLQSTLSVHQQHNSAITTVLMLLLAVSVVSYVSVSVVVVLLTQIRYQVSPIKIICYIVYLGIA